MAITSSYLHTKMANIAEQGGYSCEFVKQPPSEVQTECPVCLQILHEPYLVSCCGYSFCRVCIEEVQTRNKACPTCKEGFTVFPNKGLQRVLNNFSVHCSNKREGCIWTGELGDLDNHLNLHPQQDKLMDGCIFTTVNCIYCGDALKRTEIEAHQKEKCLKRPYHCEYCQNYEACYDDVTTNHWAVCDSKPVQCPNNCGISPARQYLNDHIANECLLTFVNCSFPGCGLKLPRKDMLEHLQNNLLKHMALLAESHKQLESENQNLKQDQLQLKNERQSLQKQVEELKTSNESIEMRQKRLESINLSLSQRVVELETKEMKLSVNQQQLEGEYQSLNKRVVELEKKVRPLWKKIFVIGATNSGNPFD